MIRRFLILQNYEIQNETTTIFEKKSQTRICPHSVGITEQLGDRKKRTNITEKRVRHKYASPQTFRYKCSIIIDDFADPYFEK